MVHFPIALLTVGWLADVYAVFRGRHEGSTLGWWNTLMGTAGLLVAAASGLMAKSTLGPLQAMPAAALSDHEQLAFLTAVVFLVLTGWRFSHKRQIPGSSPWLFLLLTGVAVILLWITAHIGGELVHEFGVGVITAPRP
jgi:uncharacterized membrane protein